MAQLIPNGSLVSRAILGARGAASVVATVNGAASALAFTTAVFFFVATPMGRGLMQDFLQNMPYGVRTLPGVEAVAGAVPPTFSENVLDLRAPLDVAISGDDQFLFVVEGADERSVKRIDLRDGSRTTLAPPRTTAATRKPLAIAVAPNGTAYVVDRLRYVVDIFGPDGAWQGALAAPPGARAWEPLAITVDGSGEVFVTNAAEDGPTVASYAPDGTVKEVFPRLAPGGVPLSFPAGIAVLEPSRGERLIIVSDSNNRRIVAVGNGGEQQWTFGDKPGPSAIGLPRGVVAIRSDRCLVVDATDHSITGWRLTKDRAEFLFRVAGPGMEDGEFLFPNGIARGSDGRVFVTDRDNDRVQIWR